MQERIILFDLDGTLTDSGPGIMKASQFALRAYGVERDCLILPVRARCY